MFAFVEVSLLFAKMDDDFGRTRDVVAMPIAARPRHYRIDRTSGGLPRGLHLFAGGNECEQRDPENNAKENHGFHERADSTAARFPINPKCDCRSCVATRLWRVRKRPAGPWLQHRLRLTLRL